MKEMQSAPRPTELPDDLPVCLDLGEEEITPSTNGTGLLAPLKIPIFRALLIATTVGNIGGQMRDSGTGWLMTSLSSSAVLVGLVSSLAYAPALFLMPLAGAVADSCDRRKMLVITQSMLCFSSAVLAVCTFSHWISPTSLLSFVAFNGVVGVFNTNCWQVVVHDVVPRDQLSSAASLHSASFNGARSVGPALGGLVIALAGPAAVFALNAVSFFGTIFVLLAWRNSPVSSHARPSSLVNALKEGFFYLMSQRLIALLIVRNMLFIAAGMSVMALLPLLVRVHLSLGPREFGILGAGFGVGAMVAALTTYALTNRFGIRCVTRVGLLLSMSTIFGIGASSALYAPLIFFSGLVLINGFSWTLVALNHNVRVRMSVPSKFSGRVFSYFALSTIGGMAVGSFLFGWLASLIGLSAAYFCAAGLSLMAFLLGIRHPMPEVYQE